MATEYLECPRCKWKVITWSIPILDQLDIRHHCQLPAILAYQYACDMHVIRMLHQRGLGNGPSQLSKALAEQHSEVWLQKCVQYFTTCNSFIVGADARKLVQKPVFSQPLCLPPVPKYRWLLTVYGQDGLQ